VFQRRYSLSRREGGDGDNTLNPGEVVELTLPFRQPIPANTDVYADFRSPCHRTPILSLRTSEMIELSGQLTGFTAAPFVPHWWEDTTGHIRDSTGHAGMIEGNYAASPG